MLSSSRRVFGRARSCLLGDLRADPYLTYLLSVSFVLAGFFVWYSLPNVVRPDEFSRLIDAMVAANYVLADPGFDALRRGINHGRVFGASFYLSALALLPAYLLAAVTGRLDAIVAANTLSSRWEVWLALPEWFWTTSLLAGRLLVVAFAVGCVYLTYRFGLRMRDRTAARLAGLLLALSFSFLRSAHEFAEDIPAVFFFLLGVVLALEYTDTGEESAFLAACGAGGLAIAFKLTAGVIVVVVGAAYLLRARSLRDAGGDALAALARPSLFVGGLVFGVGAIVFGFPSVVVSGFDPLVGRMVRGTTGKAATGGSNAIPIARQFVRDYFGALGIPLAVAAGGGVLASIPRLRARGSEANGVALVLTALSVYLFVFSRWGSVEPHHLLPTFPLLAVLAAMAVSRLDIRWPLLARSLAAVLVVTTGVYAGVGLLGYASGVDDAPEEWIRTEVPANASMEVHVPRFQTAAPLHEQPVGHYASPALGPYDRLKGQGWSPRGFKRWQRNITERSPEYIQFPAFGASYLSNATRNRYRIVASFRVEWPLRNAVQPLGGKHSYPEFLPGRWIIVMERADRCGQSPTC